jgi:hypothetical protein
VQFRDGGFATGTGNPTVAGCGCDCDGCPSCKQAANVVFDKQCEANLVMILDESGSIGPHRTTVRNAVISFLSSFSTINQIGGTATLGLVEFAGSARLVNPECALNDPAPCDPANLPGDRCRGRMCLLETDWINAVTNYMLADGGNDDDEKYTTGGCTNWGDALYQTTINNWRNNAGDAVKPDVVLFFTDGQPTVHTGMGKCNTNCNQNRDRAATANMKVGRCFGNHVGVGCYWSDILKENGVKVFLVGVGGINNHIPFTEIVTGPVAWDQEVDTFGSSDYVLNADFAQLGAIFYNVAKGLCQCLQDQAPCVNKGGFPTCADSSNFDARVRITATANSAAFAANSVIEGYMYLDVFADPARFALEYIANGTTSTVERTDYVNTCQVQRRISCGATCFTTADTGFFPRIYVENSDATVGAPTSGFLPNAACASGAQVLQKSTPIADQLTQIEYLWVRGSSEICAARDLAGTLYEFWEDSAKTTVGINTRAPTAKPQQFNRMTNGTNATFNFQAAASCSSPICNAEAEILFVIDYNVELSDFFNVKEYVKTIANSFDDANNRIAMAAWFKDPALRIPAGTGLQSQLKTFGNQVGGVTQPSGDKAVDVHDLIMAAIDSVWPTAPAPGSPPRYLITILGSADTGDMASNTAEKNAFAQKRLDRSIVEAWVTAYKEGGLQLDLLNAISDTFENPTRNPALPRPAYTHVFVAGTSDLLATQAVDQSARMCPRADLCGGTCQGYCLCGVCLCPTCATPADMCQSSTCPNPSSGCTIQDKRNKLISNGGCLPAQASRQNCTVYGCDASTGNCQAPQDCASCNCTSAGPCMFNSIQNCLTANPVCTPTPITCSGDLCGQQCNPLTDLCDGGVANLACNDNNGCTKDSCVVRIIGGVQQGVCQYVDNTEVLCPPSSECAVSSCTNHPENASFTCSEQNITSLFDLCGICLGDFTVCFFSSVNNAAAAGGIAGGVIAGIVVAAVAAALLIAFFSKKGYDAFQANSAMGAGMSNTNPAFQGNEMRGSNPLG